MAASDSATERAIRFAVYLTGGLVTLAFGILFVSSDLGEVLNCLYQTDICSGGFAQSIYFDTVPPLVGGSIMVVIAVVLFLLAGRIRSSAL
jgi:hypothetical protein